MQSLAKDPSAFSCKDTGSPKPPLSHTNNATNYPHMSHDASLFTFSARTKLISLAMASQGAFVQQSSPH
eukprot:2912540-Karenia_brevis.AAC.1